MTALEPGPLPSSNPTRPAPSDAGNQALRESEERFRQIANSIDHVFWAVDLLPARRVNYVSPAFERIWGQPAEAVHADGYPWLEGVHPDDRDAVRTAFEGWLAAPEAGRFAMEYRIVGRDGQTRWISDRGQPVMDAAGRVYRVTGVAKDVTARHAAADALRASQRHFRLLTESIPQLVWTSRPMTGCDYVNPQWLAFTGLTAAQVQGEAWLDAVHPDDRDAVAAGWWHANEDRAAFEGEARLRRHDGAWRWFRIGMRALLDDEGRFEFCLGSGSDIHELHEATAALREERDRMMMVAAAAPSIVHSFRVEPDGRIRFAYGAERVAGLCGLQGHRLDLDASAMQQRLHPDDADMLVATILASAREGTPWRAEFRYAHPTRGEIWIEGHSRPRREADGSVVWHGVLTDITQRKHDDRQRFNNQAILDAAFTHMNDGLIVTLQDGSVPIWNPAALKMFGYASVDEIGAPLRELSALVEVSTLEGEPVAFDDWRLIRALRGEKVVNREARLRHLGQGWEKVCAYNVTPVHDAEGRVWCVILQISDITERKRHEAEILQLNSGLERRVAERTASLEAANRELEAFSYSVSHDLRAPLRALDGFTETMLREHAERLPETGREHLRIIRQSAASMGRLIDDLLAFARLAREPLARRRIETRLLVQSALRTLAPLQQGRRIEWRIGELGETRGDVAMLRQVWVNLLSNALKYSRRRDPAVIEIGREGGEFFVRDNGAGFEMKDTAKLFAVFERLHGEDVFEGTGVGLAIVQRIVQRHGGNVRAEGAIDAGASFFFTLGPDAVRTD